MTQFYLGLLIAGLLLIGAEVFVPGGILGTFGAFLLLIAAAMGFIIFPPFIAALALVGSILLVAASIFLWIRLFPKTPVGKDMMVSRDLKDAHAANAELPALLGLTGKTLTDLCPSGFADINGKRVDVISVADTIAAGTQVKIVRVEGYRVLVEPVPPPGQSS